MLSGKTNYIKPALWIFIIVSLGWCGTQRPTLDGQKSLERIQQGAAIMDAERARQDRIRYNECVMRHGRDYCGFYESAGVDFNQK